MLALCKGNDIVSVWTFRINLSPSVFQLWTQRCVGAGIKFGNPFNHFLCMLLTVSSISKLNRVEHIYKMWEENQFIVNWIAGVILYQVRIVPISSYCVPRIVQVLELCPSNCVHILELCPSNYVMILNLCHWNPRIVSLSSAEVFELCH